MKFERGLAGRFTDAVMVAVMSTCLVPGAAFAEAGSAAQVAAGGGASSSELAASASSSEAAQIDDELIVTYKSGKSIKSIVKTSKVDSESTEKLMDDADGSDISLVTLDQGEDSETAIAALEDDPRVESVEKNVRFHALSTSVNDTYASYSYYLQTEGFADAWDVSRAQGAVTVAVLDSGVTMSSQYRDSELAGTVDYDNAYDVTDEGPGKLASSFVDTCGHGTAVSELISAQANNSSGIAGTSYDAKVLPVRVLDDNGEGTTAEIIAGYDYVLSVADKLNVKVVNLSLGGETDASEASALSTLQKVIDTAYDKGILTVAAAGNDGSSADGNPIEYPAALDHVLAVGAVDSSGTVASWSEHQSYVDLTAAGVGVYVPWFFEQSSSRNPGWDWGWGWGLGGNSRSNTVVYTYTANNYISEDGTSFSAPIVSGAAALLYASDSSATAAEVEEALESSATDRGTSGKDNYYGYGEVNAAAALSALSSARERAEQEQAAAAKAAAKAKSAFKASKSKVAVKKRAKKSVKLSWKALSGAQGYRLYYRVKGKKSWKKVSVSKTSKTVSGLKRKTKYQFRVRAYSKAWNGTTTWSKYSATVTAKTK